MNAAQSPNPPSSEPPKPIRRRGVLASIGEAVPTLLVLALVAAVGWWGHKNGWKPPKFSALNGEVKPTDDWCAEHSVPESICIECNDSLLPKPKSVGWCKLHGVPECVLCHPELAQTKKPAVSPELLAQSKQALEFMPRTANNPNCQTHDRRVQFATNDDAEKAGVAVEPVWRGLPGRSAIDGIAVALETDVALWIDEDLLADGKVATQLEKLFSARLFNQRPVS